MTRRVTCTRREDTAIDPTPISLPFTPYLAMEPTAHTPGQGGSSGLVLDSDPLKTQSGPLKHLEQRAET